MTYSDKLKDPRWQKKRLEILERDNWTCRLCESDRKSLNVHHKYYSNKVNLWEYPNESLITYCEKCHSHIHRIIKQICNLMTNVPDVKKSDYAHVITLSLAMMQSIKNENIIETIHPVIKSFIDSQENNSNE